MKIAHLADIHLSELTGPIKNGENARMMDTVRCMDYAADKLREEHPDIILIAGDLFHKSKLWADEMLKEITIASNWLRMLADIAPTVLMFGTANHDNIKAFENIRNMQIPNLKVVTSPQFFNVETKSGDIQIAAVPGMDKGYFRTLYPGMNMEDENKAISEALGNVITGISADADPNTPTVLMAHYTVTGCQLENGETIFLNSDVVLPTAALQASNYDLVCLGHIHKAQQVPNCGRPTYYSGPLNGITFNEEGQDKGFYIHEINDDPLSEFYKAVDSKFIKTPSREFLTLNFDNDDVEMYVNGGNEENTVVPNEVKDKIVRVIYNCTDELNKQFNKKSLEKLIYGMGAFYVQEIRPSKIITTTDKNSMSENDSVENNLAETLKRVGYPEKEIKEIVDIARPFIVEITASLPTGKLSGIFEPVALEVKNYRSYRNESFDFSKVSFATVNGPNGIGKSSFFMDAIADCLYEEPREGELTGWISNDEDARSGAITFSFLMGTDKWKVIRTRAKSGRTTLALQKWNKDKWEDHSESKKDNTQKKIINLLGMDSMTFKSCALIMQDQYGLFLEADKTERMQVLGNILGLSIYDKLHELVKDSLRNYKREVEKLKSDIEVLDEKLKFKNEIEEKLKGYEFKKSEISDKILQGENKVQKLEENLKKFNVLDVKIQAITDKIVALENGTNVKKEEMSTLEFEANEAQKIVDQESEILEKIKEYEETKDKIAELKAQKQVMQQTQSQLNEVERDIENLQKRSNDNDIDIEVLKSELGDKELLEKEVKKLPKLEERFNELEKEEKIYQKMLDDENKARQVYDAAQDKKKNDISKLEIKLNNALKKAQLIENSNCPINNPSCNFLKDALKAKNEIPKLEDAINNYDMAEIDKAREVYQETKDAYKNFDYNYDEFKEVKEEIDILKKRKEQLLSLEGKSELLESYIKLRKNLDAEIEELRVKRAMLIGKIDLFKVGTQLLEKMESELPILEHWYKQKDEIPKAKQILENANKRIEQLESEIEKARADIKNIEIDRDKLATERAYFDGTEELLQDLKSKIAIWQASKSDMDLNIGACKSKVDDLRKCEIDRKEKSEKLTESAKVTSQFAVLVQTFSIDGIPFQIVRSVVAELSAKSNEILSQMTGGKMSIEFKMDKILKNKKEVNALEIWINDYQRGTMPYLSRSGGQKVKAALSVAFALADLKANRAGIQLGMMFIDEPPFLDEEGTQAYADALELMHSQYGDMKVIAISHDPTMKARFPQSIDVVDTGEGSKIIFNE